MRLLRRSPVGAYARHGGVLLAGMPGGGGVSERTSIWMSGGGTQSSAIAALIVQGVLPKPDLAVIVDTEREQSTTWEYMDRIVVPALLSVGLVLHRVKKSRYATVDLMGGADGQSLLIPAFTNKSGEIGKLPAFCSNEWKLRVARRWAAKEHDVKSAVQWIGFTTDELQRLKPASQGKWMEDYPLVRLKKNRGDCTALVLRMGWPTPPRSSCWMCPNHTQEEWRDIRDNKPDDWRKVILFDRYIRTKDPHAYLHGDCVPIEEADLDDANGCMFSRCESGACFV